MHEPREPPEMQQCPNVSQVCTADVKVSESGQGCEALRAGVADQGVRQVQAGKNGGRMSPVKEMNRESEEMKESKKYKDG